MQKATGFLTARQRRWAWLGFVLAALQAPVSARLASDDSWLFSVCIALMVATVIIADDVQQFYLDYLLVAKTTTLTAIVDSAEAARKEAQAKIRYQQAVRQTEAKQPLNTFLNPDQPPPQ